MTDSMYSYVCILSLTLTGALKITSVDQRGNVTAAGIDAKEWEDIRPCMGKCSPNYMSSVPSHDGFRFDKGNSSYHSITDMSALLQNRRVVFMGDSLTQHHYCLLSCALQTKHGPPSIKFGEDGGSRHQVHEFPNIKLEFVGGGLVWKNPPRKNGFKEDWRNTQNLNNSFDLIAEFSKYFERLHPEDVILINVGVHETRQKEMVEDSYHGNHVSRAYDETLKNLAVADLQSDSQHRDLKNTALLVADLVANKKVGPHVFWRETAPSHFDSDTGTKPYKRSLYGRKTRGFKCVPARYSSDVHNDMANPILEASHVHIVRVFAPLLPMFNYHPFRDDCIHWSLNAYELMNDMFLDELQSTL